MVVQDHVERMQLAVMNTGNTDLFIGLEWLWRHNPSINWKKSQILFNRCPADCGFISSLDDLEWGQVRDVLQQTFHLSDGKQVFTYDVDSWVANRVAADGYSEEPAEVTEDENGYRRSITSFQTYLQRKILRSYLNADPGTMPSNWLQDSSR